MKVTSPPLTVEVTRVEALEAEAEAKVLWRWAEALMKGAERIVELAEAFEGGPEA